MVVSKNKIKWPIYGWQYRIYAALRYIFCICVVLHKKKIPYTIFQVGGFQFKGISLFHDCGIDINEN